MKTKLLGTAEIAEIVCAFGDISGFTKWMEKVTRANQAIDLLKRINSIFKEVAARYKCFYKRTGDGCLLIFHLQMFERSKRVIEALFATWQMTKEIENMIGTMNDPHPKGFRVRLTRGPAIGWKDDKDEDFYGPDINRCFRLLKKYRKERFVCTGAVKSMIDAKEARQAGLIFSVIKHTKNWRFNFTIKKNQ